MPAIILSRGSCGSEPRPSYSRRLGQRHRPDPIVHHPQPQDVARVGTLGLGQIRLKGIRDQRLGRCVFYVAKSHDFGGTSQRRGLEMLLTFVQLVPRDGVERFMQANDVLVRDRNIDVRSLERRADWIRLETVRLVEIAGSGHYSSVFSCAEILAVLYYKVLRLKPFDPAWPDRDRFLLGKGHVAIGVYPVLADLGYFPTGWLDQYTRLGSPLGDHPDMRKVPGIDFSSGSIGHNLSVGVGMALAGKLADRDYKTWVLLGDAELNEGQIWEAAMSAAHYRLDNLIAIVDRNGMGLDGPMEDIMGIEPVADKFRAFGWDVHDVDGHDVAATVHAFASAQTATRPQLILARTIKGKGVARMEETPVWHLGYLDASDRAEVEAEIEERMTA